MDSAQNTSSSGEEKGEGNPKSPAYFIYVLLKTEVRQGFRIDQMQDRREERLASQWQLGLLKLNSISDMAWSKG